MNPRWTDYVRARGDGVAGLIAAARHGTESVTVFLGAGFDPRALVGIRLLMSIVPAGSLKVVVLELPSASQASAATAMAEANRKALAQDLLNGSVVSRSLPRQEVADYRAAGIATLRLLYELGEVPESGVVVVDVSSLPAAVYYPVIGGFLEAEKAGAFHGQFLVMVCENPAVDQAIVEEGTSDPGPIIGFGHGFSSAAREDTTRVWAPVLGEGQGPQLRSIRDFLQPDEVCPVLPYPSRSPRRGDSLLVEHSALLFDDLGVEAGNIIYADESNPFDIYRALCRLYDRYHLHMGHLGDILIATSLHSSKLLSVGVLLAAYEKGLAVVTSATTDYLVKEGLDVPSLASSNTLHCLWLLGEPYA